MEQESGEQLKITEVTSPDMGEEDSDIEENSDSAVVIAVHAPNREELARPIRKSLAVANQLLDQEVCDASDRAQIAHKVAVGELTLTRAGGVDDRAGIAAGTSRDCVDNAISVATAGVKPVTDIVVNNFAALGDDIASIKERVERVVDAGVSIHVVDTGVVIDSESSDVVLGVLDGLDAAGLELEREARVSDLESVDMPDGGRAPLGFEWVDGELVPGDNFNHVRTVLSATRSGSVAKNEAARRLDTSFKTIERALDRPERYSLPPVIDSWD